MWTDQKSAVTKWNTPMVEGNEIIEVPEDVYDPDPKNPYTCVIEHIDAEVERNASAN